MFKKRPPSLNDLLIKRALTEVEKLMKDLSADGKDLRYLKMKKYQKTHHQGCKCPKCAQAARMDDPTLRGLLEVGFKVYVEEMDPED